MFPIQFTSTSARRRFVRRGAIALSAFALAAGAATITSGGATPPGPRAGTLTAVVMQKAGHRDAHADYWEAVGSCINLSDPWERFESLAEARDEFDEALDLVAEQFAARMELVDLLGEAPYDPEIDPDNFVDVIDNPFRPMIPGTTLVYEADTEDGLEQIVVFVTDQTKEIQGVECTVVRDTVTIDGELVEDTDDYFAQDVDGNVWYFGEISRNYEDGELSDVEGSWKAGEDGAKAGIIVFAAPVVGTTFRQEFLLGEAEDVATILAIDETVTIGYGTFDHCVQTEDFTPLEPDVSEHKFYAPGVGVVLEVDLESGETAELVGVYTE